MFGFTPGLSHDFCVESPVGHSPKSGDSSPVARRGEKSKIGRPAYILRFSSSCLCRVAPRDLQHPKFITRTVLPSVNLSHHEDHTENRARGAGGPCLVVVRVLPAQDGTGAFSRGTMSMDVADLYAQGLQNLLDRIERMRGLGPEFVDITWFVSFKCLTDIIGYTHALSPGMLAGAHRTSLQNSSRHVRASSESRPACT